MRRKSTHSGNRVLIFVKTFAQWDLLMAFSNISGGLIIVHLISA
jgi:hypothetical protein